MVAIKKDIDAAGVIEEDATDREKSREMLCCGDP